MYRNSVTMSSIIYRVGSLIPSRHLRGRGTIPANTGMVEGSAAQLPVTCKRPTGLQPDPRSAPDRSENLAFGALPQSHRFGDPSVSTTVVQLSCAIVLPTRVIPECQLSTAIVLPSLPSLPPPSTATRKGLFSLIL